MAAYRDEGARVEWCQLTGTSTEVVVLLFGRSSISTTTRSAMAALWSLQRRLPPITR